MRRKLVVLFLVAFCVTESSRASADTFYIAEAARGGSDSNSGSLSNPWASLNHALSQVAGGDTIVFEDGVYDRATRTERSFSDWVTIRARNRYRATLTAVTSGKTIVQVATKGTAKLVFEGFVFTNKHSTYTCPDGREPHYLFHIESAKEVTVRDSIFFGNNAPGTCNELLKINRFDTTQYPRDVRVAGNLFFDHADADGADMIDSVRGGEVDIVDNIFFATDATKAQSFITIKRQAPIPADLPTPRSPRHVVARNIFLNWNGKTDQAFIQLGEDTNAEVMVSDAIIENNLLIGNSANVMAAAIQLKGPRDVTVRANTIVGDLPAGAYGFRIGTEGSNPQVKDIFVYNNIWSDPSGTMGSLFAKTYGDVDTTSIKLNRNLFWNGGAALPAGAVPPSSDANRIELNPLLNEDHSSIELSASDDPLKQFTGGSTSIRDVFVELVMLYGRIPANSPARNAADATNMPTDDILGRTRDELPDIGAYEFLPTPDTGTRQDGGVSRPDGGQATPDGSVPDSGGSTNPPQDDSGCSVVNPAAAGICFVVVFFALFAGRRRRRSM